MVKAVLFFVSRLVCVTFLVIAGITLPEIWSLTKEDFTRSDDGFTVYIPLEMCAPQTISVDGLAIIFDSRDANQCHALVYLVGACAASLIFAGVAMLLFFLFDMMARCECGPITSSAVLGMSIFMALGLTQTAACCWALYKECGYRQDFFMQMFDKRGAGDIATVRTHGDRAWFLATMIAAIVAAALLLLDSILHFLCYGRRHNRKSSDNGNSSVHNVAGGGNSMDAASTSAATQKAGNNNNNNNNDPESRPGWTSY